MKYHLRLLILIPALLCAFTAHSRAEDTLYWNTNNSKVTADVRSTDFFRVLQAVSAATGWKVFVEPETKHSVSAKFKELPPGDAMRLLFGDVNFALIPGTNGTQKLFVFRTAMARATRLMLPAKLGEAAHAGPKKISDELIVRLKPGAKIEDIAKALGAKVIGRIDGLNAYRLKFEDQAAAESGREQLASNSDVASVEDNFSIDRPTVPREITSGAPPPPHLQLTPPSGSDRIIVGLVDTAVQPLGNGLDAFLLKQLSVAGDATLDPTSPSHGTSMAETMLRSLQGVTKGSTSVQILPVDVYGPNESTSTFDVANGIATAVNKGANPINLSLGSPGDSPLMHDLITEASGKGIVFIGAAGNEPVTTPFYPAAYPEVLAVTALDQGQLAPYANRGSFVSLAAPGTSVIYYNNRPYYVMGTSTAAAYLSGALGGYMDSTHSTAGQGKTFLGNNFGFKPGGK
jgi:hypothetical protein